MADRHRVQARLPDGSVAETGVCLFGEPDGTGRLARVDEVSRLVSGRAQDADLARAR